MGWSKLGLLIFALVLLGVVWFSKGVLAQSPSSNLMTISDCSSANAINDPDCAWALAKMEGSYFDGVKMQEGTWSFRYDRWGQPVNIAKTLPNGIPDSHEFMVYDGQDKLLLKEKFEGADPNHPGGFLKAELEFNEFYPQNSPEAGKPKMSFGLYSDATNITPQGAPSSFIIIKTYNYYSSPDRIKTRLVVRDLANLGTTVRTETTNTFLRSDGRVDKIIKDIKGSGGTLLSLEEITYKYLQANDSFAGTKSRFADCQLSPSHCHYNSTTHFYEIFKTQTLTDVSSVSYDTTDPANPFLKSWTTKIIKGANPGDPAPNVNPAPFKVVECNITYNFSNKIPMANFPPVLSDYGMNETKLPTSLRCETTQGGPESGELTFNWAPWWRFAATAY